MNERLFQAARPVEYEKNKNNTNSKNCKMLKDVRSLDIKNKKNWKPFIHLFIISANDVEMLLWSLRKSGWLCTRRLKPGFH